MSDRICLHTLVLQSTLRTVRTYMIHPSSPLKDTLDVVSPKVLSTCSPTLGRTGPCQCACVWLARGEWCWVFGNVDMLYDQVEQW